MGNPPRIGPGIHPAPISGPTVILIIKNMMDRGMFLARPGGLLDRRGSVGGQMKAGAAAARHLFMLSDMRHPMAQIRDIMGRNVITIPEEETALDAARLLRDRDISFLVTLKEGTPTGILTERDIVRKVAAEGKSSSDVTIQEIRTPTFLSVDPSTPIEVAVQKMINSNIRRLVVLEDGLLVGVVTQTDLTNFLRSKLLINGTITKTDTA